MLDDLRARGHVLRRQETEFFENIGGVKSYTVDVFRLAGQREIGGLLDDGSGLFGERSVRQASASSGYQRPWILRLSLR